MTKKSVDHCHLLKLDFYALCLQSISSHKEIEKLNDMAELQNSRLIQIKSSCNDCEIISIYY